MRRHVSSFCVRPARTLIAILLMSVLLFAGSCGGSRHTTAPVIPPDTNPPGDVSDLTVTRQDSTSITIRWTAPGNDGQTGTAAAYEIRYGNIDYVSRYDWSAWTVLPSPPIPHAAGTPESLHVTGLVPGSPYLLALRARDSKNNWSDQSNVAAGYTTGYRAGPLLVIASQLQPFARYSKNGGRTWQDSYVGGSQRMFGQLTAVSAKGDKIYATAPLRGQSLLGAGACRLWYTENAGITWNVVANTVASNTSGYQYGGVQGLAVSGTTLYATIMGACGLGGNNCCGNCTGTIMRSTNEGHNWSSADGSGVFGYPYPPFQGMSLPYPAVAVDPTDPNKVYMGGLNYCYYPPGGTACFPSFLRSTDGGISWSGNTTGIKESNVFTLAVHPAAPTHLFASTSQGLKRSLDSGASWAVVFPATDSLGFIFDSSNPNRIYTPRLKSLDGGATWVPMATPLLARRQLGLDVSRHELYAVGEGGLYRSADEGTTWTQLLAGMDITSIVVGEDPVKPLTRRTRANTALRK